MFIIAAVVCMLLLILAGSNMFVAQYNPVGLISQGIHRNDGLPVNLLARRKSKDMSGYFFAQHLPTAR